MRGSRDFDDLAAYRRFIDEMSAAAMPATPSASIERAELQELPDRRTADYERSPCASPPRAASRCARCSTPCPRA
jgi:hypothetical protein